MVLLEILRLLKDLLVHLVPVHRRVAVLRQHQDQPDLELGLDVVALVPVGVSGLVINHNLLRRCPVLAHAQDVLHPVDLHGLGEHLAYPDVHLRGVRDQPIGQLEDDGTHRQVEVDAFALILAHPLGADACHRQP